MDMDDIGRGWTVYTEDGKRLGDVVEVHPHYLLVSRGLLIVRDVYVPRYAVAAADDQLADDFALAEPVFDDYGDMGIMFGTAVEVDGDAYLAVRRLGDGPPL